MTICESLPPLSPSQRKIFVVPTPWGLCFGPCVHASSAKADRTKDWQVIQKLSFIG